MVIYDNRTTGVSSEKKFGLIYRKIPKISPGAYINFLTALFEGLIFEGFIFGGAYLRREICLSKSIGPALYLEVNLSFLLCFTLYFEDNFLSRSPRGANIWRGDLAERFLRYRYGGPIFGGAYFRNFTVLYNASFCIFRYMCSSLLSIKVCEQHCTFIENRYHSIH